jgi:hypothetical protein
MSRDAQHLQSRFTVSQLSRWTGWVLFAALFCTCFTACQDRPTSLTVALNYFPSNTISNAWALPPGQGKIYILPVDDERKGDKTKIGENLEDPTKVVPISSGLPAPADWLHDTLGDVLRNNGLNVVTSADDADLMMNVTLTVLWVNEADDYNGQITMIIKIQDKNGKVLFTATTSGQYELSGKSLTSSNYSQVLSNSLYAAVNRLLNAPGFQQSLVVGH